MEGGLADLVVSGWRSTSVGVLVGSWFDISYDGWRLLDFVWVSIVRLPLLATYLYSR